MKSRYLLALTVLSMCFSLNAQTAPSQASAAGYKHLAFHDEFDSTDTISPDGTGNYNWYRTNIYGSPSLPADGYSIHDGVLEIKTDASGYAYGLATVSPENTVQTWQHGYFEARVRFCSTCSQGEGWPSFWSSSIEHATGQIPEGDPSAELDIFEYYVSGKTRAYLTTVHQTLGDSKGLQNSNNVPKVSKSEGYAEWHIFGCLWTPNEVRWYFDNKLVTTVKTGPGTIFTALEQSNMFLVLGAGEKWPMYVDYVRVWK
jgi:beta-glucanase (GH16 family)